MGVELLTFEPSSLTTSINHLSSDPLLFLNKGTSKTIRRFSFFPGALELLTNNLISKVNFFSNFTDPLDLFFLLAHCTFHRLLYFNCPPDWLPCLKLFFIRHRHGPGQDNQTTNRRVVSLKAAQPPRWFCGSRIWSLHNALKGQSTITYN